MTRPACDNVFRRRNMIKSHQTTLGTRHAHATVEQTIASANSGCSQKSIGRTCPVLNTQHDKIDRQWASTSLKKRGLMISCAKPLSPELCTHLFSLGCPCLLNMPKLAVQKAREHKSSWISVTNQTIAERICSCSKPTRYYLQRPDMLDRDISSSDLGGLQPWEFACRATCTASGDALMCDSELHHDINQIILAQGSLAPNTRRPSKFYVQHCPATFGIKIPITCDETPIHFHEHSHTFACGNCGRSAACGI